MNKQKIFFIIIIIAITTSVIILNHNLPKDETLDENHLDNTTPTPTPTPQTKPVVIDIIVTPWGDMYRTQPDCKTDFSVELVTPKQNVTFSTNTIEIVINAGAYKWIVEKAFFTSDLFSGERWIPISKNQYKMDLQKTFTFTLYNVPKGQHELTLTVIFHEGTRNQTISYFNVLT